MLYGGGESPNSSLPYFGLGRAIGLSHKYLLFSSSFTALKDGGVIILIGGGECVRLSSFLSYTPSIVLNVGLSLLSHAEAKGESNNNNGGSITIQGGTSFAGYGGFMGLISGHCGLWLFDRLATCVFARFGSNHAASPAGAVSDLPELFWQGGESWRSSLASQLARALQCH